MMKNTFKPLVVVLAIVLIFTAVGIPVDAQGNIEGGTTSSGEGQTLQGTGINATVPGGPGFIMVHPTAFIPVNSTLEYQIGVGGYLYNPGSINSYYEAAVNLPHGAKVTKVVVYYLDNSSTDDIWVGLAAIGMDIPDLSIMASLASTGADTTNRVMEDTTITLDTIDNQSYAYWIEVGIPGGQSTNLQIRGIRIDYSYPVNLPLVNK
jgi:hypothetical protein